MRTEKILRVMQAALDTESNKHYIGYSNTENQRGYKCSVDGCDNWAYAKKLCNAHYLRKRNGKSLIRPLRCVRHGNYKCSCGKLRGNTGGWHLCAECYGRKRRKILKEAVVHLLDGVCKRCRGAFPSYVFDFHHLKGKRMGVGMLFEAASLTRIAKEISECILLCANCHREVTYG